MKKYKYRLKYAFYGRISRVYVYYIQYKKWWSPSWITTDTIWGIENAKQALEVLKETHKSES